MAARLPLRTLLRDIIMMLCGSAVGMLLAKGFLVYDMKMANLAEVCGTLHVSKRDGKSRSDYQQFTMRRGGASSHEAQEVGLYPYQGYAGSGPTERGWWKQEVESSSQGSGGSVETAWNMHSVTIST